MCSSVEDDVRVVDTRNDRRGGREEGGDAAILPRRFSPISSDVHVSVHGWLELVPPIEASKHVTAYNFLCRP
jgi:hypothetical protein